MLQTWWNLAILCYNDKIPVRKKNWKYEHVPKYGTELVRQVPGTVPFCIQFTCIYFTGLIQISMKETPSTYGIGTVSITVWNTPLKNKRKSSQSFFF